MPTPSCLRGKVKEIEKKGISSHSCNRSYKAVLTKRKAFRFCTDRTKEQR